MKHTQEQRNRELQDIHNKGQADGSSGNDVWPGNDDCRLLRRRKRIPGIGAGESFMVVVHTVVVRVGGIGRAVDGIEAGD